MSDDYDDYDDYEEAYEEGFEEGYEEGSRSRRRSSSYNRGNRNSGPRNEGCYIATSVYGSYDCPEVWTLRRFRDYRLRESALGRSFVKFYYAVSPTLVRWFSNIKWLTRFTRFLLDRFVAYLQGTGIKDTPYKDWKNNSHR